MKVDVSLTGVDGVLATLRALPPELVSRNGGPVRAALRKGAMVIVKQAQANFRAAVAQPGKTGITDTTGFTEKQIGLRRKNPPQGVKGEKFLVLVKYIEHPSGKASRRASRRAADSTRRIRKRMARAIRANDIAYMMEYGTSKQAATPWLRPAFLSRAEEAIQTTQTELLSRIDRIVKKLAAQNARK
ncbi:MAG: hypothetical protein K0S48_67 [Ramlibacter sp.]|jgi:hypothetical protein|nr:hypothetical protein [Ramlibacter sp.]